MRIDIFQPVEEQTECYVSVKKDVSIDSSNVHGPDHFIQEILKLCLDSRILNETLGRKPYYNKNVDELTGKFSGEILFTIMDMDKGY